MACVHALTALLLVSFAAQAQTPLPNDTLGPLLRELLLAIEALSDYTPPAVLPPVFEVPQHALEARICDEPCNVMAAYLPGEGIYLAGHLDPVREPRDRAALLHELVHALQQGHPKFARLAPCEREYTKEKEAYALQNAYLGMIGNAERVAFYGGEFDCAQNEAVTASWANLTPQQAETLLQIARDLVPREELADSAYSACIDVQDKAAGDPAEKQALDEALKLVDGASRRMGYRAYTEIGDEYERLRLAKMLGEGPWMRQFKRSLESCLDERTSR
jgi:hypothetical protein